MNAASNSQERLLTVIPVYNGERYIAETLLSVARQTRRPDKLVVLDNCSTDGTREIVAGFGAQCEWRRNETNLGLFGNLNRALELAEVADYLHILHADDIIKPTFYQRFLEHAPEGSGRAMLYCSSELIDERGIVVGSSRRTGSGARHIRRRDFLSRRAELTPFYFPAVVLKTLRGKTPVKFRTDMPQLADQVFWAEWATQCTDIVELDESLARYRVHSESGTTRNLSDLQAWVLDEYRAMTEIETMANHSGLRKWIRRHKLRCLFAARSQVKIKQVRATAPEFAEAARKATRSTSGALHWVLASLAVGVLR